jgi:hypothetical protein
MEAHSHIITEKIIHHAKGKTGPKKKMIRIPKKARATPVDMRVLSINFLKKLRIKVKSWAF